MYAAVRAAAAAAAAPTAALARTQISSIRILPSLFVRVSVRLRDGGTVRVRVRVRARVRARARARDMTHMVRDMTHMG